MRAYPLRFLWLFALLALPHCALCETFEAEPDACDPGSLEPGCSCDFEGMSQGVCARATIGPGDPPVCLRPDDQYAVEARLCDGLDNDCDGQTDERCPCQTGSGLGVCSVARRDERGACLESPLHQPSESACDGYDNDCDGTTDEGCPTCTYRGVTDGVCPYGVAREGSQACDPPPNWTEDERECTVDPLAGDGVDNDCDGTIDEGCACPFGPAARGVCLLGRRAANEACAEPLAYQPEESACDGLDNDCDGRVDEGCDAPDPDVDAGLDVDAGPDVGPDADAGPSAPTPIALFGGDGGICSILSSGGLECSGVTGLAPASLRARTDLVNGSLGRRFGCVVTSAGAVECWGMGSSKFSAGRPRDWESAVIPRIADAVEVAAGPLAACARLRSGQVRCWGEVFGDDPRPIANLRDATQLDASNFSWCATRASGGVVCWTLLDGASTTGGPIGGSRRDPIRSRSITGVSDATQIAVGPGFGCALRASGSRACWGSNSSGQFGDSSTSSSPSMFTAVSISDALTFTRIEARERGLCALSQAGQVYCWGEDLAGGLGTGRATESAMTPQRVPGITGATDLATDDASLVCVLSGSGVRTCWGAGPGGGVGAAGEAYALEPRVYGAAIERGALGPNGAQKIAAAPGRLCARSAAGPWSCAGKSTLAHPTASLATELFLAPSPSRYACAILPGSALPSCWGMMNAQGVGDLEDPDLSLRAPLTIAGVGPTSTLALGPTHACALEASGAIKCTGFLYQEIASDRRAYELPRAVPGLTDITHLAAGSDHSCAIAGSEARVHCWGRNADGLLGSISTGGPPVRLTPVEVPGSAGATALTIGASHSCALIGSGALCWGSYGDDPTMLSTDAAPAIVTGTAGATALSSSDSISCALMTNGTVRCWGFGVLGDGNNPGLNRESVEVSGITDAIAIEGSCALRAGGEVWCWGENESGQLADGTRLDSFVPIRADLLYR